MTNIIGTVTGSKGTPLTGKLFVTLSGVLTTDGSPKTISVPKRDEFTITSGTININLEETETDKISYKFEIFETDNGDIVEPILLEFFAIVPNETTVQFADLIPTSIQNSQLDSGALRISKLIISNPIFVDGIKNLSKPVVIAGNGTDQVINSSVTVLDFNTEVSDTSGVFSFNRFTVPSGFAGIYIISGVIPISNTSGASRDVTIALRRNGTIITNLLQNNIGNNSTYDFTFNYPIQLNATDYIELVTVTSGGFAITSLGTRKNLFIRRLGV